ncbi:hypothetical protein LAZ67_12000440 [Cordylochernes scorpioides]|uniref:Uncharacterized protein n=1 Tax=Cordylochernes scorpioides TaxID=51811 RepID=A0ABY6L1B7_9ARAC|nr:hypothetical protein LAZ67_12000440 [Cordylochernes scorpioides]
MEKNPMCRSSCDIVERFPLARVSSHGVCSIVIGRGVLSWRFYCTKTNVSILNEINPGRFPESQICKQTLTYFGHIMRENNQIGEYLSPYSHQRKRGRPAMSWLEGIKKATRRSLDESDGH